jgi:flagellar biogenesis protein FliO
MAQVPPRPLSFRKAAFVAMVLLLPVTPLFAQQLGQGTADTDFSLWRVFAAVAFLAVLAGIAWALVKARGRPLQFFKPITQRRIEIVETARISTQASLCLARFEGAEYLLAVTPGGATLLEKRPIAADPADTDG